MIRDFDIAVFKLINGGLASPALDYVMLVATAVGVGLVQSGISLAFILAGLFRDRVRWRQAGYAGSTALAFSGVLVQIFKHLWDRPRPILALYDVRIVGDPLFVHSFPSGHTMTAFAVMVACSAFLPRLRYVLIALAAVTGLSRVYLGVHFPLDVIYGALLGTLTGLMSARLVRGAPDESGASGRKACPEA